MRKWQEIEQKSIRRIIVSGSQFLDRDFWVVNRNFFSSDHGAKYRVFRPGLHIVAMTPSNDILQEILATNMLTAVKSKLNYSPRQVPQL